MESLILFISIMVILCVWFIGVNVDIKAPDVNKTPQAKRKGKDHVYPTTQI